MTLEGAPMTLEGRATAAAAAAAMWRTCFSAKTSLFMTPFHTYMGLENVRPTIVREVN